ncbi:MAG: hypothetical protein KDK70_39050, partial [Myxococcales bacterium]|nr:hypothetical protein [Myxococcales bacterium]
GAPRKASLISGSQHAAPAPTPTPSPLGRASAPVAGEAVSSGRRSGSSSSSQAWGRVEASSPDPSEIPAFLRRRGDDGYLR